MRSEWMEELLSCLRRLKLGKLAVRVVVMPDFFIDRLVTYQGDIKNFSQAVAEVAGRKGGAIHEIRQIELRGGNAANTAAALAALGVKVYPIISTSLLGLHLLKFYLGPFDVDLSHVKTSGRESLTTALELLHEGERVNIMMGDLGSLPNLGPKDLSEEDFKLLKEADYVCVFNWASTRRWGTELASSVFHFVREKGKGKTYYDTGDPSPNSKEISKLMKNVLLRGIVDVFSVSESEALLYATQLNPEIKPLKKKLRHQDLAVECARTLAKHIAARIDLHTTAFAGSFTSKEEVIVPTFRVSILRSTGAGDAWNAGNIVGDALELSDSCRLTLANAVAAYYISSPNAEHPSLAKLEKFCLTKQGI